MCSAATRSPRYRAQPDAEQSRALFGVIYITCNLSVDDHCHATDKETKWKTLRLAFKCKWLRASHPEKENAMYPAMASVDRLSLGNQNPLQNVVNQNQQMHTSVRTARPGRGSNNSQKAQITHPVEPTVSAPKVYTATMAKRGNAHTTQITYPTNTSNYLPEPEPDQYEDYGKDTPTEYGSEGSTVYVGNLPYHIDDESLTLSFDHAGVVVFSEIVQVIYDDKTGQSRGFGYVTMITVEEAEKAVRTYHVYLLEMFVSYAKGRLWKPYALGFAD
ncbi:28 kDa ribonucleoprotein, chloroplastic [Hordeum vulgare]|nr:28 kDa ribonucleoprotein, chloroplastic [Hordeum vulgare]